MKAYEKALEELEFPQVPYYVQGGYGEPVSATAVVGILGTVGQIAGGVLGMNQQQKMQEAQLQAQTQVQREQALIQGEIAAQQAANEAQHAANMPLYLLIGGGVIIGLGVVISKRKK